MARQGAPHATMVEAFTRRLQQLYPTPIVTYSLGRVVKPIGLKPDIYVEHPDGRRWAFEMVHGNRSAEHLLENHERYADAGISDHWILWDSLRPESGSSFNPDQGFWLSALEKPKRYRLTKPHQAILGMQTGDTRYLYSFTATGIDKISDTATLDYLRLLGIGVDIYKFEGWDGEDQFFADSDFITINVLEFGPDGSLFVQDSQWSKETITQLMPNLGFTEDGPVFLRAIFGNFESMLSGEGGIQTILLATLAPILASATPEEYNDPQKLDHELKWIRLSLTSSWRTKNDSKTTAA